MLFLTINTQLNPKARSLFSSPSDVTFVTFAAVGVGLTLILCTCIVECQSQYHAGSNSSIIMGHV